MIPIVMVTALSEKEHAVKAMEAGADDFLSKPVDHTELIVRVKSLLRIKAYHDKLRDSYHEIAEKNEKLRTLERKKEELTNMIIHDLRSPLTRGLGLDRRPLSPAAALDEVLAEVGPIATKKGLELRVEMADDLPSVHADPVRFRQICFDLLTNAVKFTPVGGTIAVTARAVRGSVRETANRHIGIEPSDPGDERSRRAPNWLEVSVADTGIGIRSEDLPRLFEQFAQLESVYTKRHAGSGIGLALTRQLVELHGGRIWAESDGEGKGSTFRVVLPCEVSGEVQGAAAASGTAAARQ